MKSLEKIKMVLLDVDGTLTDGGIYVHHDGTQTKRFHAHDGEGIRRCLEAGVEIGIISAASLAKDMIEARAKMLGIKYVHAFRSNKREVAEKWSAELGLKPEEIAFVGDDIIDLEVMQWCGVSAAPSNAHESIIPFVTILLKKAGGNGAVREFLDKVLDAKK